MINAYGSNDVFINKLDPNGNFIWVKRIGGPGIDYAGKIKVDTSGNIYSCGYFSLAAIDLDPGLVHIH
ncbi:MAG: SBBP repeat-containing protein [Sphingobacteriaceae bacterium]|nr:SBBP repeat-containing protein [Sphingobacteriaceae bacterium]